MAGLGPRARFRGDTVWDERPIWAMLGSAAERCALHRAPMSRHFKTGTVAHRLGIAPALLRMWESRYGFVVPTRGPGGQRLYTEGDIAVLDAARVLLDRGHAVGELAGWPKEDLLEAAGELGGRGDTPRAPSSAGLEVLLSVDRDGRIGVVSPNVEQLLGWQHGLLVGQPIWGLILDVPAAFERIVSGAEPTRRPRVFWAWLRRRVGDAVPCRLATGSPRRAPDGTSVTIAISPLAAEGGEALSSVLGKVEREGIVGYGGSPDELLREYVLRSVEHHGAALSRAWSYSAEDGSLRLVASAGLSKAVDTSSRSVIRLARYPYKVGVVARSGVPYIHNGLEDDPDFDGRWIGHEKLESAAVLPLVRDGRLLGVTAHFFRKRLTSEEVGQLQASASTCRSMLEALTTQGQPPKRSPRAAPSGPPKPRR